MHPLRFISRGRTWLLAVALAYCAASVQAQDAPVERGHYLVTTIERDGRAMPPPMAFAWYAGIRDGDLDAIVAYLRSLPAQAR